MKRYIIIAVALAVSHQSLLGQSSEELAKQVTVTRSFDPSIKSATKSSFTPREESISVEPEEFDYSIVPTPIEYALTATKLSREDIDISEEISETLLSARAAIGFPIESLLDLYYGAHVIDNLTVGASLNHYGYYGKLENDLGIEEAAGDSQNRLAAYLNYRRSKVYANLRIGYNHNSYKRYGYSITPMEDDLDLKERYNIFDLHLEVGTPFNSYKRGVNGKFTIDMTTGSNIASIGDTQTRLGLDVGIPLSGGGKSTLDLGLAYNILSREEGALSDIGDRNTFEVKPTYRIKGSVADFRVGVNYVHASYDDNVYEEKSNYLMPLLSLEFSTMKSSLIPYINLDGEYKSNSFISLSNLNPYITNGATPATIAQRLYAGIKGEVQSVFEYNVYFGADVTENMIIFANSGYGNTFTPIACDDKSFTAGVESKIKMSKSVSLSGAWKFNGYDDEVFGLAQHRGDIAITYTKDELLEVTVKGHIEGRRTCLNYLNSTLSSGIATPSYNEISATTDLSLLGSYRYSEKLAFFAELGNLLNQKLYTYNSYRGIGFNVMVGAKFNF